MLLVFCAVIGQSQNVLWRIFFFGTLVQSTLLENADLNLAHSTQFLNGIRIHNAAVWTEAPESQAPPGLNGISRSAVLRQSGHLEPPLQMHCIIRVQAAVLILGPMHVWIMQFVRDVIPVSLGEDCHWGICRGLHYHQILMKHPCGVFLDCGWPHFPEMSDGAARWSHTRGFCPVTLQGLLPCSLTGSHRKPIWHATVETELVEHLLWLFTFTKVHAPCSKWNTSLSPHTHTHTHALCNYLWLSELELSHDGADNSEALWRG